MFHLLAEKWGGSILGLSPDEDENEEDDDEDDDEVADDLVVEQIN